VAIAALSGLGQDGDSFCRLFGTTGPHDRAELAGRFGSHEGFVAAWSAATDAAVTTGVLLPADAEHLQRVAAESTIGA
jgi:hypothetical protein